MITYEYIPYLERSVWVQYERVIEYQRIESSAPRMMVWGKYSWSDSPSGPWTPFRWIPFGLRAVA